MNYPAVFVYISNNNITICARCLFTDTSSSAAQTAAAIARLHYITIASLTHTCIKLCLHPCPRLSCHSAMLFLQTWQTCFVFAGINYIHVDLGREIKKLPVVLNSFQPQVTYCPDAIVLASQATKPIAVENSIQSQVHQQIDKLAYSELQ